MVLCFEASKLIKNIYSYVVEPAFQELVNPAEKNIFMCFYLWRQVHFCFRSEQWDDCKQKLTISSKKTNISGLILKKQGYIGIEFINLSYFI